VLRALLRPPLQTVRVQQVLALLVALHAALLALEALSGQAPEQALALVAVGRVREVAHLEVVRCRQRDGVDERLQGLLVDVLLELFVVEGLARGGHACAALVRAQGHVRHQSDRLAALRHVRHGVDDLVEGVVLAGTMVEKIRVLF